MIYIYGTDDCNNCKWAVRDSKKNKEEYTYKNITYKKFYNEMIERGGDPRKIPQIWWDAEYVGDYDDLTKKFFEKLY